jgi:hypothetical protein
LWLLFQVPSESRDALFGEDAIAAGCFLLAMVATVGLLHHLAALAFGDASRRQLRTSLILLALTVTTMVVAQQRIRRELHERMPLQAMIADFVAP